MKKGKIMVKKIKKLYEEIKKTFVQGLPKAIADIFLKLITYTIPVLIFTCVGNWIINPQMDITDVQANVLSDKLVLSEENSNPDIGKEFVIPNTVDSTTIVLSNFYSYYAPELEIKFNGVGKIKSAYIIYEQNEVDNPDELIVQKVSIPQKWRTHFKIFSKKCIVTCNYVNKAEKTTKFMYIYLIGSDGTQYISCIYLDMSSGECEIINIEEIYQLIPNEMSVFGLNKQKIQQDVEDILKLDLN